MKIIGPNQDYSEIELDPVKAYRRGRVLDAMLRSGLPPPKRGVYRGTFEEFERLDEARMVEAARRVGTAGQAPAALPTTGIRKGIYRFASHAEMNRHTNEGLAHAAALNLRLHKIDSEVLERMLRYLGR
jgi:hypothetical protein